MKHLLLTTIAAVLVVGCGEGQESPLKKENSQAGRELIVAIRKGDIETIKQHLEAGVDVNVKGQGGRTPLHTAAQLSQKAIIELLIANGADVNAMDGGGLWEGGGTPLDMNNIGEIADLLRKHGGKTAKWLKAAESIHIAAESGNLEAVKKHLVAGADVNIPDDRFGMTPLYHAAFWGHTNVIELLIASGADVNTKNRVGSTPLDLIETDSRKESAALLRKDGGKTSDELKAEGK